MKRINPYRVLGEVVLWSAFLASGGHIYQVATRMGNMPMIALVHAVGLDGLVYVGINSCRTGGRGAWVRGIICVIYGGGMSLAFNAASYSTSGVLPGWVIAMSMPVSLVLAVIAGHGAVKDSTPDVPVSRPRPVRVPASVPTVRGTPAVMSHPGSTPRVAKEWDRDKATRLLSEGRPRKEIAELCGVSRKSIDRLAESLSTDQVDG